MTNQLLAELEMANKKIENLQNIIKEVREYIKEQLSQGGERELRDLVDGYELLEILDKEMIECYQNKKKKLKSV